MDKVPGIEGWAAVENTGCFGQMKTNTQLPFTIFEFTLSLETWELPRDWWVNLKRIDPSQNIELSDLF